MKINKSRLEQFWECVVEEKEGRTKGQSPCWLWIGSYVYIPQLYGRLSTVGASTCSAVIACRDIPGKVTHRCKNNLCVNPMHLMYGLAKDRKQQRFSALTGRPLAPKVHEDRDFIEKVLAARGIEYIPGHPRKVTKQLTKVSVLMRQFKASEATIKKVLLKAPMYDLLYELKKLEELKLPIKTKPNKHETTLDPVDSARFQQNYQLSISGVTKNASGKI